MGASFGGKLRSERLDRHLTQTQLGSETLSPHGIHLLEAGRREPGPGTLRLLSQRLAAARLRPGCPAEGGGALFLELSARQALDERDYDAALRLAGAAAEAASAAGDPGTWWSMTYFAAWCLHTLDRSREAAGQASRLIVHPLAGERPALAAKAEILLAAAHRDTGNLRGSAEHARTAVHLAQGRDIGAELFLEAWLALVAALSESGQLDSAWEYCRTVVLPLLEAGVCREDRAKALWGVGNAAFLRGDTRTGLRHHRAAADLLIPCADVELWARFNSATAAMRLGAGIHDDETLACIEHAEAAAAVAGPREPQRLELLHCRGLWLDLTGAHYEAVGILSEVYAHRYSLSPQAAGEVGLHLGMALVRTGDGAAGAGYLAESVQAFRAAGAEARAAHAAALARGLAAE